MKELMQKYLFLIIIFAISLVIIFALTLVFQNRKKKDYYLYGLLMNLYNKEIFSLSLVAVNFILLIFTLIFKIKINGPIIIISSILVILSYLLIIKPSKIIINFLINSVNLSVLYLANLVNTLKLSNSSDFKYLFLQILLNIFGIFFFLLTHLKFVKDIRKKEKNEKTASIYSR